MTSHKHLVTIALFVVAGVGSYYIGHAIVRTPDDGVGLMVGGVAALLCFVALRRDEPDRRFLLRLLVVGLIARWLVGLGIYYWQLEARIGPDIHTYDYFGYHLLRAWQGLLDPNVPWLARFTNLNRSGWGMYYYVAGVYYVLGRVPLAFQLINCALGAYSAILVYKIAYLVYPQQRVARMAGMLTTVAPSMVLWTSQGIKEAPIVFCLSLSAYCTLKLSNKFAAQKLVLLLVALFGLYALRHYAFYIIFAASVSALLLSAKKFTPVRTLQGVALVTMLALAFAYFGAGQVMQNSLDSMDMKRIQNIRSWSAKVATSGFGSEVDVTDTRAALQFLPLGVLYVLFAPFPWMINNFTQLLLLPEMVLWWAAAPLLVRGYWFAIRRRLKESLPLCIFTVGLTLMYALFLSNVGTVHRQRAQLLVFFCVFISIGYEQWYTARQARSNKARSQFPNLVPTRGAAAPTLLATFPIKEQTL